MAEITGASSNPSSSRTWQMFETPQASEDKRRAVVAGVVLLVVLGAFAANYLSSVEKPQPLDILQGELVKSAGMSEEDEARDMFDAQGEHDTVHNLHRSVTVTERRGEMPEHNDKSHGEAPVPSVAAEVQR